MPVAPAEWTCARACASSSAAPSEKMASCTRATVVPGTIAQSTAETVTTPRVTLTDRLCGVSRPLDEQGDLAAGRPQDGIGQLLVCHAGVEVLPTSRILSPLCRPARSAGPSATTEVTTGVEPDSSRLTPIPT